MPCHFAAALERLPPRLCKLAREAWRSVRGTGRALEVSSHAGPEPGQTHELDAGSAFQASKWSKRISTAAIVLVAMGGFFFLVSMVLGWRWRWVGWVDGWMGWMSGWVGWLDGWLDGWMGWDAAKPTVPTHTLTHTVRSVGDSTKPPCPPCPPHLENTFRTLPSFLPSLTLSQPRPIVCLLLRAPSILCIAGINRTHHSCPSCWGQWFVYCQSAAKCCHIQQPPCILT